MSIASHPSAACPLFLRYLLSTSVSTIINSMTDAATITTMTITATKAPLRDEDSAIAGETKIESKTHTNHHLLASAIY